MGANPAYECALFWLIHRKENTIVQQVALSSMTPRSYRNGQLIFSGFPLRPDLSFRDLLTVLNWMRPRACDANRPSNASPLSPPVSAHVV